MLLSVEDNFSFKAGETIRIDMALMNAGKGISRRGAKRLLGEGRVAVEGKIVKIASRIVRAGERISVIASLPSITILQENSDFIAIDKPPGLSSQPAEDPRTPSAIEVVGSMLRRREPSAPVAPSLVPVQINPLHLVHRLDTPASGVLAFAKHGVSAASLSEAFRLREMKKVYVAIVEGALLSPLTINAPIAKESAGFSEVGDAGDFALTTVTPLRSSEVASLVAVSIKTGRMHQIRTHLSSVGHPIRGDRKYGEDFRFPRLYLHALMLEHRTVGRIVAPIPADFHKAIAAIGLSQITDEEALRDYPAEAS